MSAPAITLRPATAGDLAGVGALPGLSDSTRRSLAGDLGRDDVVARVATSPAVVRSSGGSAEQVRGVALGQRLLDEGHVLDLAVAPADRRAGLGTRLLHALVDGLLAVGCQAVTLEVRASNRAAQALYRRAGFTVEGRRIGYYPDGEDALVCWLRPHATADPDGSA